MIRDGAWKSKISGVDFQRRLEGPDEVIPSTYGHAGERYGGFYTQEEIKDIVAYAATLHIEIIPEIDLPGHSKAIIATYPQILCDLTDYRALSIQGYPTMCGVYRRKKITKCWKTLSGKWRNCFRLLIFTLEAMKL